MVIYVSLLKHPYNKAAVNVDNDLEYGENNC